VCVCVRACMLAIPELIRLNSTREGLEGGWDHFQKVLVHRAVELARVSHAVQRINSAWKHFSEGQRVDRVTDVVARYVERHEIMYVHSSLLERLSRSKVEVA
jgi:hypothetical protein